MHDANIRCAISSQTGIPGRSGTRLHRRLQLGGGIDAAHPGLHRHRLNIFRPWPDLLALLRPGREADRRRVAVVTAGILGHTGGAMGQGFGIFRRLQRPQPGI